MGVNGYVWVSVSVGERGKEGVEGFVDADAVFSDKNDVRESFFFLLPLTSREGCTYGTDCQRFSISSSV
jgi:hypothetical protein